VTGKALSGDGVDGGRAIAFLAALVAYTPPLSLWASRNLEFQLSEAPIGRAGGSMT
jgi:hypothetical protein